MDKLVELLSLWRKDPVLGVKQLFSVEPTEQQKKLIRGAWHPTARVAVSSCQGAGKTATLAWLMFLFLLTQEDCQILVTSPSYQQLTRVFNAQVHKWHAKMPAVFRDQFVISKEKIALKGKEGFQFASLVTASAEHTENLQGGHAESYVILIDEASGVEEDVFDLLLGTLSTHKGGRLIMTSNPLRAAGRFYEVFHREAMAKWKRLYFSAYDSPVINTEWIDEMKGTYGEDSDIFRVRVLGQFPRVSSTQFFPTDIVKDAAATKVDENIFMNYPRISGVDIARFGDDSTVFVTRQGPKLLDVTTYHGIDTMEVSSKLMDYHLKWKSGIICIDSIGIGAGVFDRAKQLNLPVKEVVVSQKSTDPQQYLNMRSQLYGLTREWIQNGADIPNDERLIRQFTSMQYGYNNKMQLQLMTKKDLKKQGLESPDIVDAVALTFAGEAIARREHNIKPRHVRKSSYVWA
jgi:hypothetical protein